MMRDETLAITKKRWKRMARIACGRYLLVSAHEEVVRHVGVTREPLEVHLSRVWVPVPSSRKSRRTQRSKTRGLYLHRAITKKKRVLQRAHHLSSQTTTRWRRSGSRVDPSTLHTSPT